MHIYLYIYIYMHISISKRGNDEDKEDLVFTQPVSLVYICILYN